MVYNKQVNDVKNHLPVRKEIRMMMKEVPL